MSARASRLPAVLAAVGAATLWGTTGTAQALGPDGLTPIAVGAVRVVVGALVLVAVALATRPRGVRDGAESASEAPAVARLPDPADAAARVSRVRIALVVAAGGIAVAAYQAFFFVGVARAGVAVGTVVALGVAPVATGVLGLLLGERPGLRWVVATAGAVLGVAVLVGSTVGSARGVDLVGLAAAAGAGLAYAGYTIAARALLLRGLRGVAVMAAFFVVAAVLTVPAVVGEDLRPLASADGIALVVWLGVIATGLSYVLFQRGLARLNAGTVATLSLAEPVTATLLAVLVLREPLTAGAAAGILAVVLSLAVLALPARRG